MENITVIVESPKGSNHKYDWEPDTKRFKLMKILPAGLVFPFDFGFIPDTKGEDGDPLDAMIISEISSYPGCVMDCRIIGAIQAEQTERDGEVTRNDRFLAVPIVSQLFAEVTDLIHLSEATIGQLEQFFKNYNYQAGKKFEVKARLNAKQALELVK